MFRFWKKKNKINVVVIGNCQARPLAQKLTAISGRVKVTAIGIVHLLKNEETDTYAKHFLSADWIFAQRVMDNYPCTFVRSKELKANWGNKVVVWPNIFFRGYNPELTYIRNANRSPLRGPLGDYHNQTILEGWKEGIKPAEALRRHLDIEYNREQYGKIPEASLSELRMRESDCDIEIADYIAKNQSDRRLFFTFNHPVAELLSETAKNLLHWARIPNDRNHSSDDFEPLGQFCPPVNPWVVHELGLDPPVADSWCGVEVVKIDKEGTETGKNKRFGGLEIVETYYRIYDANEDAI